MTSSLGYTAKVNQTDATRKPQTPVVPAPAPVEHTMTMPTCRTIKGFLPTLAYSALAIMAPLLLFIVGGYDFTDDVTRGMTIGLSALAAGIIIYADNCIVWYNIALFFHTGLEVYIIKEGLDYASHDDTSDAGMALSLAGSIVIIVHLIPFFLVDSKGLLTLLAAAGVVVNTAMFVFVKPGEETKLLLTSASAVALLAITLLVIGINQATPSMLTLLRGALAEGTWLTCTTYDM
jgi:hypothetical protein